MKKKALVLFISAVSAVLITHDGKKVNCLSKGIGDDDVADINLFEQHFRLICVITKEMAEIQCLKRLEIDVEAMKLNLKVLKTSSDSFLKVRSRFFAVFFKRRISKNALKPISTSIVASRYPYGKLALTVCFYLVRRE